MRAHSGVEACARDRRLLGRAGELLETTRRFAVHVVEHVGNGRDDASSATCGGGVSVHTRMLGAQAKVNEMDAPALGGE